MNRFIGSSPVVTTNNYHTICWFTQFTITPQLIFSVLICIQLIFTILQLLRTALHCTNQCYRLTPDIAVLQHALSLQSTVRLYHTAHEISLSGVQERSTLHVRLPNGIFPSDLAINRLSWIHALQHMHVTCPAHLTLLDVIILIMFGEEYKLWISSPCSFLQSPVTSSLIGPNIFSALS
jgi:hypothetical protein